MPQVFTSTICICILFTSGNWSLSIRFQLPSLTHSYAYINHSYLQSQGTKTLQAWLYSICIAPTALPFLYTLSIQKCGSCLSTSLYFELLCDIPIPSVTSSYKPTNLTFPWEAVTLSVSTNAFVKQVSHIAISLSVSFKSLFKKGLTWTYFWIVLLKCHKWDYQN